MVIERAEARQSLLQRLPTRKEVITAVNELSQSWYISTIDPKRQSINPQAKLNSLASHPALKSDDISRKQFSKWETFHHGLVAITTGEYDIRIYDTLKQDKM
ncbi:hypothetical protein HYU93_04655 [Candidatus Daviesbacteria bacterium]|nr:hypothetical protein [Candidatus Daviesbacteria bacterium]